MSTHCHKQLKSAMKAIEAKAASMTMESANDCSDEELELAIAIVLYNQAQQTTAAAEAALLDAQQAEQAWLDTVLVKQAELEACRSSPDPAAP